MADYDEPLSMSERRMIAHQHDWREEAWQCYLQSGEASEGADARHLNPGEALAAVTELRESYDEACDEVAAEGKMRAEAEERAATAERNVLACQGDLTSMQRRIVIYVAALRGIAEETGTPYGRQAREALDAARPGRPELREDAA